MFETKVKWYKIAESEESLIAQMGEKGRLARTVNATNVCLLNDSGTIRAVRDKCPHQGYTLSQGACIEDGKVICPWHHYGFDLKNGRGAGLYLEIYPIEQRDDGLYLGMEYFSWF